MVDLIERLSIDDSSFFFSELKQYYDIGYGLDDDPAVSFIVSQIIFEKITLRHRQALSLIQEHSVDKDLDDSISRSLTRMDKLMKMLKTHDPKTNSNDSPLSSGSAGEEQETGMY